MIRKKQHVVLGLDFGNLFKVNYKLSNTMHLIRLLLGLFAIKNTLVTQESFCPFPEHLNPECDPPNVSADTDDQLYNITKSHWAKEKLYELESFKITHIDKINLAKEVLLIFDNDILSAMGNNVMAGGLLDDWDYDI